MTTICRILHSLQAPPTPPMPSITEFLANRRSTPSRLLGDPGPDPEQLRYLLQTALCVPDHGRLSPWRLLIIERAQGDQLGQRLADLLLQRDPATPSAALEKERGRFNRTPITVVVVHTPTPGHKVPECEQRLSGGCVAMMLLLAAEATGFGAQWLTGWPAYDRLVMDWLGLGEQESIVGFIYIGTPSGDGPRFERPVLEARLSYFQAG